MTKKYAMGIDIGGTNTAFGLVDEDGNVIAESKIPTDKFKYYDDYKPYMETLAASMKELISSQPECDLIGIGVGAPNANIHSGRIETPANLWKFEDPQDPRPNSIRIFNFVEDLSRLMGGAKVMVTNDANAAAIGEMVFGNARGMKDFAMITLGTGLGSGIVCNGEMVYGHDGFAGEYGHIAVDSRETGRQCGCGRKGCLEAYVSATGIKRTAFDLMASMTCESELRSIPYEKFEARCSLTQLQRTILSLLRPSSAQARFSAWLLPTSQQSHHPRLSSSLVAWLMPATTSCAPHTSIWRRTSSAYSRARLSL